MGTEEFWVPVALAALSGGAQYANQRQAQSKENASETQNIIDQQQLQDKANGQVRQLTDQIGQNSPAQIQRQATGDYVSELRKNAAGSSQGGGTSNGSTLYGQSTSALPPSAAPGANARYNADTAKSQQEVSDFGNQNASEMGALDAAVRQRQNEGLATGTLATNLNTLNQQSWGRNFVNQLRAQAAGTPNPFVSLFAGALGAGAKNYTGGGKTTTPVNPWLMPNGNTGYNFGGQPLDAGNGIAVDPGLA
jgi:hypothetical protein